MPDGAPGACGPYLIFRAVSWNLQASASSNLL